VHSLIALLATLAIAAPALASEPPPVSPTSPAQPTAAPASASPEAKPGEDAKTSGPPAEPPSTEPFAWADWGWMNGASHQTEFPLDGKVFSGEFTIETEYAYEFSNPKDHTVIGSTAIGRSNEIQIEHLGVGGDFHWKGARGRIMTQLGTYATMTPRNDASPGRGQWDLADAYRYITEGYGGYHFDIDHGLNIDAGIFLSYVGLCSYYNYENWTDQASYVSSNTPWFFNGIRIQYFPTDRLKIEPWIINGWQSYGVFNEMPGLGVQIAWRPTDWLATVFSGYFGRDTLGDASRTRWHTDNSLLIRYFQNSESFLSKGAFSLTVDLGCENGGGVSCVGGDSNAPTQAFAGAMLYNRFWFLHDTVGFTFGGGLMTNPGRYLTLTPPINGATAFSGSSYFPQTPGTDFKAWDATFTLDYMPSQFFTLRAEYTHRAANVPYFAGPNGITPPGGNQGLPGSTVDGWAPDLQKTEDRVMLAMFVRI
jgi:Putative beta-barrel porin-2, OmpL-like. bbp2